MSGLKYYELISLLANNKKLSVLEIRNKLGYSKATIQGLIKTLISEKKITFEISRNNPKRIPIKFYSLIK